MSLVDARVNIETQSAPTERPPSATPECRTPRCSQVSPLVGHTIRKEFPGFAGAFQGQVLRYDAKRRYYSVRYQDGDEEELTEKELHHYLVVEAEI